VLLSQAVCLRLCRQWKAVRSQVCAVASQSQAARRRMAGRPPRHHCTSLAHCATASNASTLVLLSVLKQAMCRLGSLNTVQNYSMCTKQLCTLQSRYCGSSHITLFRLPLFTCAAIPARVLKAVMGDLGALQVR